MNTSSKLSRRAAVLSMSVIAVLALSACSDSQSPTELSSVAPLPSNQVSVTISEALVSDGQIVRVQFDYPHTRGDSPRLQARLSWDAEKFEYVPSVYEQYLDVQSGGRSDGWMVIEITDAVVMSSERLILYFRATEDAETASFRAEGEVRFGEDLIE